MRCPQVTYKGEISQVVVMLQNNSILPCPHQQRTEERADSSDHVTLVSSNRQVPCPSQSHWPLVVGVRTSMGRADLIRLVKINYFFP